MTLDTEHFHHVVIRQRSGVQCLYASTLRQAIFNTAGGLYRHKEGNLDISKGSTMSAATQVYRGAGYGSYLNVSLSDYTNKQFAVLLASTLDGSIGYFEGEGLTKFWHEQLRDTSSGSYIDLYIYTDINVSSRIHYYSADESHYNQALVYVF